MWKYPRFEFSCFWFSVRTAEFASVRLENSLLLPFQDWHEAAGGVGCKERDTSAARVWGADGTASSVYAIGRAGTLRAAGSVPSKTGPSPAGPRSRGGETQRPSKVNLQLKKSSGSLYKYFFSHNLIVWRFNQENLFWRWKRTTRINFRDWRN